MKREALLTWTAIGALALLSAGLGLWLGRRVFLPAEQPPPPGLAVATPGQPLPLIALPELQSGALMRISGPGRPRLINYWASWCGPCRSEMPALDAYSFEQGENGVQVIGIALDNRDDALAFAREVAVGFPLLLEAPGPADSSVQLGNARGVLPYTALVDAQGRLVKTHYGAFSSAAAVEDFAGQ